MTEECRLKNGAAQIKCSTSPEPDLNPQLQKDQDSLLHQVLQSPAADFKERIFSSVPAHRPNGGPRFNPNSKESVIIKTTLLFLFPAGALCRCSGRSDLSLRATFRHIYANVQEKSCWISHSWVTEREWVTGHDQPSSTASRSLVDFLPLEYTSPLFILSCSLFGK